MEMIHQHIILLLNEKYGITEVTVYGDDSAFKAVANDGVVKTEKDFTAKELSDAKDRVVAKNSADEKAKADAKAALLAKLGITADEAALLLA
jgi:hypothetical protein